MQGEEGPRGLPGLAVSSSDVLKDAYFNIIMERSLKSLCLLQGPSGARGLTGPAGPAGEKVAWNKGINVIVEVKYTSRRGLPDRRAPEATLGPQDHRGPQASENQAPQ